jgi:hypothetical protein
LQPGIQLFHLFIFAAVCHSALACPRLPHYVFSWGMSLSGDSLPRVHAFLSFLRRQESSFCRAGFSPPMVILTNSPRENYVYEINELEKASNKLNTVIEIQL